MSVSEVAQSNKDHAYRGLEVLAQGNSCANNRTKIEYSPEYTDEQTLLVLGRIR